MERESFKEYSEAAIVGRKKLSNYVTERSHCLGNPSASVDLIGNQ